MMKVRSLFLIFLLIFATHFSLEANVPFQFEQSNLLTLKGQKQAEANRFVAEANAQHEEAQKKSGKERAERKRRLSPRLNWQ